MKTSRFCPWTGYMLEKIAINWRKIEKYFYALLGAMYAIQDTLQAQKYLRETHYSLPHHTWYLQKHLAPRMGLYRSCIAVLTRWR